MAVCSLTATYSLQVDWNNDGDYSDTAENVTTDVLMTPVSFRYGRDQARALSPAGPGELAFSLCNADQMYSPGGSSPIAANVLPARPTLITITPSGGAAVTGWAGRIDELDIHSERSQRDVDIVCIDALQWLGSVTISTILHSGIRTGDAIKVILDAVGWPTAQRNIDAGVSVLPFWCIDSTSAATGLEDLVKAEGPGAILFVEAGIITFQDRHARTLDANSLTSQATYCVADNTVCTPPATGCPGGSLVYTDPFVYDHGLRNITNSVSFSVGVRAGRPLQPVWSSESSFTIAASSQITILAESDDFFTNAQTPIDGVDFITNLGSATATLSRTSGKSTLITLTAGGATTVVTELRLMAYPVVVSHIVQVTASDATSITKYGEQRYPEDVPWVNPYDAKAIADLLVAARKDRVPIVQVRTVNKDVTHENAMLARKISDLITVRNDRLGVNTDFYVEQLEHVIRGQGQLHALTIGCEQKMVTPPGNLFIFDGSAGHRFDEGVFGQ